VVSESVIGRVFGNGSVEHCFRHTQKISGGGAVKSRLYLSSQGCTSHTGGKLIHTFIGELGFMKDAGSTISKGYSIKKLEDGVVFCFRKK